MEISIVVPAYNEEENVEEFHAKVSKVMKSMKKPFEMVFVDDGSKDKTYEKLEKIAKKDPNVKIIKFRRNFGQSAAWDAGFKNAKGRYIITMDADLQNDPEDIPKLLEKIEEGYDVVSGWRFNRKDSLPKRFFSWISRLLRKFIIDDRIHDSGCSLKIYRKECFDGLDLQGEMHRYITEILSLRGFKITEIKVNHLPRKKGKTKYNLLRVPKGFLDLIVVAFWQKYSARPVHLFGSMGILSGALGTVINLYMLYLKFFMKVSIANRPLLLLGVLLCILGLQFLVFGLISDILVKMYYSGSRKNYYIEKTI
jgi:glycosyltransferase involved in cell wall biosynthesis